jgi:xanthine dehydrogenase YagS FAD-binding subunit
MKTIAKFSHVKAKTIDEAVSALRNNRAMVYAGGTDLFTTLRFDVLPDSLYPLTVISLKEISPSLDYIKEESGMLKIGALTRLEDIAKSSLVSNKWAALSQAAHRTASPHIREMGTIGGNICQLNRCWYFRKEYNRFDCIRKGGNMCYAMTGDNRYHSIFGALNACIAVNPSDLAPALVAFNAIIVTNKREIPVEDFWDFKVPGSTTLADDEIVTEIQVPNSNGKSAFVKFAIRKSIDFPVVNCAVAFDGNNARICLNAVYNKPYRATKAEDAISGKAINEENAEAAANAAVSDATSITTNKWKISVARGVIKKAIMACA